MRETTMAPEASPWRDVAPLTGVLAALRCARDVRELFARASDLARDELGGGRALVLTVAGGHLTAEDCGALADEASDHLRRRILARPVEILPRSIEAGAVGWAQGVEPASSLATVLDLDEVLVGPVAPDGTTLALVVLTREEPATPEARAAVAGFAAVVGFAVEFLLLRMRNETISGELRHLATSAQALTAELLHAPTVLPSRLGPAPSFGWEGAGATPDPSRGILSDREVDIMARLVEGRSNREIAADLVLSPDTVKGHVARIFRKLGATNRVEAVTKYLAGSGGGR
jgi:DNA-binding NarL/FixJ family response regulator